jgi:hypothetical protein
MAQRGSTVAGVIPGVVLTLAVGPAHRHDDAFGAREDAAP